MTISLSKPLVAATALAAVAAAAAVASAGSPSISITTPKYGSTISGRTSPYTAVAGKVAFAAATPGTSRFYLRRDGCGTTSDNPRLSIVSGTDGGDGCGIILDSVVGTGGDVDQGAFVDFPANDGLPLSLDTGRTATGTIDVTGTAAGLVEVDVTLEALVGGQGVTVGTASASTLLDPTVTDNPVTFTIQPSASLAGADLQALDLRVHIHGPALDAGFIGLSGKSFLDMPSFAASVNRSVSVSLDDPTFANAVPGRIDSSGSGWSVAIPTPAPGRHTIYAQSTQGFSTSAPTSTTFTVKR